MPSASATPAASVSSVVARAGSTRARGRREHDRHVQAGAGRREPRVAAPAASRRLLVGDDDETLGALAWRARARAEREGLAEREAASSLVDPIVVEAARRSTRGGRAAAAHASSAAARSVGGSEGSISKLMSTAGAECVSAPTDTKSAPVAASSGIRSSVTPPEISICGAAARARDRLANLVGGHVVDEDRLDAGGERLVDLRERLGFDLDRHPGPMRARARDRGGDAAGEADVVVLDQDRVEQADAVIDRAAGAHGVFLERAQRRRRLARVEDGDAPAGGVDEAPRARGDARQPLQEIERGALADEQGARACRATSATRRRPARVTVLLAAPRRGRPDRAGERPRTRRRGRRARSRPSRGRRRAPSAPASTVASVVMSPPRTILVERRRTMSRYSAGSSGSTAASAQGHEGITVRFSAQRQPGGRFIPVDADLAGLADAIERLHAKRGAQIGLDDRHQRAPRRRRP